MTKKPPSLLPNDKARNSPLFVILAILAFLACLCLLSFKTSHIATNKWQADLKETATIQIKPGPDFNTAQIAKAQEILLASPNISAVEVLPQDASKELLKPWLGDVVLPDDLPLPILLNVQLRPGKTLNTQGLKSALEQAGIIADIDNHAQWAKTLNAKVKAFQLLAFLTFLLITIAILAACVFAVRAGILGQKKLMDILHQIGADPRYTARIFSVKFSWTSFKAGLLGALSAFCLLFLLNLMIGGAKSDSLLPSFTIGFPDMVLAVFVPLFMGLISGMVTWHTVIKSLHDEIYS